MTALIERNTTVPCEKTEVFSTASDNQTAVDIHVVQGERPMSKDNRTLGRFQLVGLPPAPRGVPQVEVKFEIDADGIVHVSAKDKATGKEQSIKIEASSGLSKEEVEQLVKDAKSHEEEDNARRDAIEKRNQLDTMVYQTQKLVDENGDKLPEDLKGKLEAALTEGRAAVEADDPDQIVAALASIEALSHEMATSMYQAGEEAGGGGAADAGFEQAAAAGGDDVIDAEFEETD